MFEAGKDQAKMVEPVIERLTGDGDAEIVHDGEIGQPKPARLVTLTKDYLLLGPVNGAPRADPALQRASYARIEIGMTPAYLLENGDRPEARRRLQHRHDLLVP